MSALTKISFKLLGFLKAETGGSLKILHNYGCLCENIQCTHKFSSRHTGEEFIIYCNANCKTENIIYLLECAICGLQYMGEIKQQLNKRLIGHRSDANCKPDPFFTLTIVGRSRGDVSSHQDIFQTFGFPESQVGWFFEDFAQFWVFLYGCPVLTNDVG
jgi:hypothetical protein